MDSASLGAQRRLRQDATQYRAAGALTRAQHCSETAALARDCNQRNDAVLVVNHNMKNYVIHKTGSLLQVAWQVRKTRFTIGISHHLLIFSPSPTYVHFCFANRKLAYIFSVWQSCFFVIYCMIVCFFSSTRNGEINIRSPATNILLTFLCILFLFLFVLLTYRYYKQLNITVEKSNPHKKRTKQWALYQVAFHVRNNRKCY